jgi:hypothetical protein
LEGVNEKALGSLVVIELLKSEFEFASLGEVGCAHDEVGSAGFVDLVELGFGFETGSLLLEEVVLCPLFLHFSIFKHALEPELERHFCHTRLLLADLRNP